MTTYVLKKVFEKIAPPSSQYRVHATFADKSTYTNYKKGEQADIIVTFKTLGAEWWTILFFPSGFLDCYVNGTVDLEGENPIHIMAKLAHAAGVDKGSRYSFFSQSPLALIRQTWQEKQQDNAIRQQAIENAEFHYALPVELFKRMLGETVGYSEGYWTPGTQNLNQAKHNLYEYVCQKLQLKPGMKVLEVGSGWGFLPIYMVKNYDVDVIVYNPTQEQNDYMRERFKRHGVSDRIRIELGVHEDIVKEGKGTIDRFVTIGVQEHHGLKESLYEAWWRSISHVLKDKGIGVISTSSFMDYGMTAYAVLKYIWPGGHIPSVPLEISTLHKEGFTLIEWENLWPHYYKTLMLWRDRFKEYWPHIHASNPKVFTEHFRRRWTMYLEGVPEVFERGLDNSHFLFVKGRPPDEYPLTLEDRYKNAKFRTGDDTVECYE